MDIELIKNNIENKLQLYEQMQNDCKCAFENFNQYNFYDIEAVNQFSNEKFDKYKFNDKILENVAKYISQITTIPLEQLKFDGNGYPEYEIDVVGFSYFYINLKYKIVYINALKEIAFENICINNSKQKLNNIDDINPDWNGWIKDMRKVQSFMIKISDFIYLMFHRKKAKEIHQILLEKNNHDKKLCIDTIAESEKIIRKYQQVYDEIMPKLEILKQYGYEFEVREDYVNESSDNYDEYN